MLTKYYTEEVDRYKNKGKSGKWFYDSGGQTKIGKKMMQAVNDIFHGVKPAVAIRRAYDYNCCDATVRRHIRYNSYLWEMVRTKCKLELEKMGIDSGNFVEEAMDVLHLLKDRLKDAEGDSISSIAKEIRELLSMAGGNWSGLDRNVNNTEEGVLSYSFKRLRSGKQNQIAENVESELLEEDEITFNSEDEQQDEQQMEE